MGMKKKLRDIVAKRCIDFDPKAPRKRRSKRLKSLSIDLATTENGNDGEMNEREGDNIGNKLFVDQSQDSLPVVGNKPPNIRDSLDSTHITPRSPLPSDSLASLALLKLASKGQVSPILDRSQNVVELINVFEPTMQQLPKKRRGPTKIEPIAIEECNKVGITFDQFGQPIEEDSIGLSSFLGPLVREVVPVTLSDWRKLSTRSKEILWTSIQLRYNVKEDWQRKCIFQKMGRLWRAEKSRILSQIQSTSTNEELVKMKPSNIQSMYDWMEFVKEKKSTRLKEMQLPSTRCKSYTRLAEEMKKSCLDSSPVRRVALREKAHRKEDGNHVNSQVAKTLAMQNKLSDNMAKRCIDFDPKAPRRRRSKRLKSFSVDLATTEDGNDGEINAMEGDNITNKLFVDQSQDSLPVAGNERPNIVDNLDSTHTTPKSPLPSDSLASLALLKLASRGQVSPILDRSQNVGERINVSEPTMQQLPKKHRGPTKMKPIAIEECNKVDITFDQFGQPIGEASIGLSSFLGALVREIVPVTLSDWRKLSTRSKEILWTSIQLRYNVKEDWQRKCIFRKMGRLWRAGKSRIVSQIQSTSTNEELVKMKPSNIQSMHDWMDFVKEKKSATFKAKSEKFKSMKKMQLPHTCSRKGYARLTEEMRKSCLDSSSVTRIALLAKAHRKKDENPVNSQVAETLGMEKKLSDTVAKRCIDFDPKALQKRRSKRLKSLSIGPTTTEDDNDEKMNEEGDNITNKFFVDQSQDSMPVAGNKASNIGDDHDSTHTIPSSPLPLDNDSTDRTPSSPLPFDSDSTHTTPSSPFSLDRSQNSGEHINVSEQTMEQLPNNCRGPTKMRTNAIEECNKVDIIFNEFGQPIGEASIGLSSFLGLLVREVVPVTLNDWRKLSTRSKEILWKSVQLRYNMREDWQRKYIFQKMGRLWRAGKSRIVSQIQSTSTSEELVKMKPSNIKSMHDWMDFVKEKNSALFKAKSEKFKSMKKKQLPHTCSRKGYARLEEEMKKSSPDSSAVTRVAVWAKAHRKKDGNPVNSQVAEALERIEQIDNEGINTISNNAVNETISKVLGSDRSHIGALGFGATIKKFSLLSQLDSHYAELEETNDNKGIMTGSDNVINDAISKVLGPNQGGALGFGVIVKKFSQREHYTKLEEKYKKMEREMSEMRSLMSQLLKSQGNGSEHLSNATNEQIVNNVAIDPIGSSPLSINDNNALRKCKMLDWCGTGEVVAEGRWSSNDPKVIVHHVPLGPQAVRVWVDLPKRPDAFLWRPNSEMTYVKDAVGSTIAWPFDKVIIS
ncbi:uncharacterized protein LOC103493280 isoform X3 [Cucumis melo]|uniref:Uncharacterized protein LOC103493280 isoform X3 n=1 Tax=Cucumis melo TaxID=3656 RepID=A0ABM3KWR1_CUCME|nr:uncharacterized protein LOC103493280 isoform X3 [Cucumis melo]